MEDMTWEQLAKERKDRCARGAAYMVQRQAKIADRTGKYILSGLYKVMDMMGAQDVPFSPHWPNVDDLVDRLDEGKKRDVENRVGRFEELVKKGVVLRLTHHPDGLLDGLLIMCRVGITVDEAILEVKDVWRKDGYDVAEPRLYVDGNRLGRDDQLLAGTIVDVDVDVDGGGDCDGDDEGDRNEGLIIYLSIAFATVSTSTSYEDEA